MRSSTTLVLSQLSALVAAEITLHDKMMKVEHFLVDNYGHNTDIFVSKITPCGTYITGTGNTVGNTSWGEQTTAQWVRIGFHDMVTANVSAGTGGIDASIGFESSREENGGLFVNDTLNFLKPTLSPYFSTSDAIALAVATSLGVCGTTTPAYSMPDLRAGRIDATEAGPYGAPNVTTSIEDTIALFENAGLTQSEGIALTACGHSLGRVHYTNFPTVVNSSWVTSTNIDGGAPIDTTPDVYDNAVVIEYLEGTGNGGGPLVTSSNVSVRSDYRLYISDNNVTMATLVEDDAFFSICKGLFEKMIDTVPATVNLSDVVTPMEWKPYRFHMDVDSNGSLTVNGTIRYLYDATTSTAPESVPYNYTTSSGTTSADQLTTEVPGTGYGLFGNTSYYLFNTSVPADISAVNFGDYSYALDNQIFIIPSKSSTNTNETTVSLTTAALTSLLTEETMTATFYVPTEQTGTLSLYIAEQYLTMEKSEVRGNYTLFTGEINLGLTPYSDFNHVAVDVKTGNLESASMEVGLIGWICYVLCNF